MKKVLALILAISTLFLLCACDGAQDDGDITMGQVIESSIASLSDISSVHSSAAVVMDLSVGGQAVSSELGMESDIDIANGIFGATIQSTANGETQLIDMYARIGDTWDIYMNTDGQWIKMEGISEDALGGASVNTNLQEDFKFYFDSILAAEDASFELKEINGKDHYALSAPIYLSSMDEAKKFSIDSFISTFLGDTSDAAAVAEALSSAGAITVSVYVDTETFKPYGFTADFSQLLAGIADAEITQAYASSVYTDYNNVPVTIPEEALNGMDLSALQQ